jgi:hypothetical protein
MGPTVIYIDAEGMCKTLTNTFKTITVDEGGCLLGCSAV